MSHPGNALQKAVYDRLRGYASLTSVLGTDSLGGQKVYDHAPQGEAAPFVLIGDDTETDASDKTANRWEFTVNIHAWSHVAAGRKQVKAILGHVYDALHQQESNLTVTGFTLVNLRYEFATSFQDTTPEGKSDTYYHGVMRFRAVVE